MSSHDHGVETTRLSNNSNSDSHILNIINYKAILGQYKYMFIICMKMFVVGFDELDACAVICTSKSKSMSK